MLIGIVLMGSGCEEDSVSIHDQLIGKWTEYAPCKSCNTFLFTQSDSIIQINTKTNERLFAYFEITSNNTIKVKRDWELEDSKQITNHEIHFYSNDTLEISQFLPVDYGLFGFEDVKLVRNK